MSSSDAGNCGLWPGICSTAASAAASGLKRGHLGDVDVAVLAVMGDVCSSRPSPAVDVVRGRGFVPPGVSPAFLSLWM